MGMSMDESAHLLYRLQNGHIPTVNKVRRRRHRWQQHRCRLHRLPDRTAAGCTHPTIHPTTHNPRSNNPQHARTRSPGWR